jgi:hypothetical protein
VFNLNMQVKVLTGVCSSEDDELDDDELELELEDDEELL